MDTPLRIFKEYAQGVLKEQAAEVQKHYSNKEGVKKSLRLKVFNDHLDILKEQLQNKMNDVILQSALKSAKDRTALENKLSGCYDDCIHEFLKKDFDQ